MCARKHFSSEPGQGGTEDGMAANAMPSTLGNPQGRIQYEHFLDQILDRQLSRLRLGFVGEASATRCDAASKICIIDVFRC